MYDLKYNKMKINYLALIFFLVFLSCFSAKGQDFLVTNKLDSLNCKLGKLENDHYTIIFYIDDEKFSGTIHKDSILFFKKNMFRSLRSNRLMPWYPLKEFGIDVGGIHQAGPFRIDDDLTGKSDFAAKTGFYAGADLTFYMTKMTGYGLKYNYRSLLGGDVKYQYVGPMLGLRFWDKNRKHYCFSHISGGFGWMVQKNAPIQIMNIRPRIEMSAKSFVGDISIGYNHRISNNIAVRLKLSGLVGYPSFIRIHDLQKLTDANDKPLEIGKYCNNMNTINLSVGFIFRSTKPYD